MMETKILPADDPSAMERALALLRGGGLAAFPTDTVYGLGALADSESSIEALYVVKGRDASKAIPILIGSVEDLAQVSPDPGELALRLAARFWPGPLTLVVPKSPHLPEALSALPTVGVRMPDHPAALALLRLAGPLAVTSANLSGGESPSTAEEVFDQLGGRIPLVLDGGRTPGGQPSTVVDCTGQEPKILRQGPLTLEDLRQRW
jgi:L-threonylcarbamoyladenylate synthase